MDHHQFIDTKCDLFAIYLKIQHGYLESKVTEHGYLESKITEHGYLESKITQDNTKEGDKVR